jgi:hypothetical protein
MRRPAEYTAALGRDVLVKRDPIIYTLHCLPALERFSRRLFYDGSYWRLPHPPSYKTREACGFRWWAWRRWQKEGDPKLIRPDLLELDSMTGHDASECIDLRVKYVRGSEKPGIFKVLAIFQDSFHHALRRDGKSNCKRCVRLVAGIAWIHCRHSRNIGCGADVEQSTSNMKVRCR